MRLRLWMTRGCRVALRGGDPAELVTALCLDGISVNALHGSAESGYVLDTDDSSLAAVLAAAEKFGLEAHPVARKGFGRFLRRFRIHRLLLLLLAAFLLPTAFFSTRIWELDVVGNQTLTRAEILSALETAGVYPGVSCLAVDNAKVRSYLKEMLPQLIWSTVQVHGSRAVVVVRERRQPPEIVDEKRYGDLIAVKSGVLDKVSIREGRREVKKGDLVLAGQTLASGTLTDRQQETRLVHAMGEVWAQTWYEKTMVTPLEVYEPLLTGSSNRKFALKICDFRMNFYFDSRISDGSYVKIEKEVCPAVLGLSLPFSIVETELRNVETLRRELSAEEAEALLCERLLHWLDAETDGAERLSAEFESVQTDGMLQVTLRAVCREQIAAERPYSDGNGNAAP